MKFDRPKKKFEMPSVEDVLILVPEKNYILNWNLKHNTKEEIKYQFEFQYPDKNNLHYFPETQYFAVQEFSFSDLSFLKITYFHYPFNRNEEGNPICSYE